MSEFKGTSGKWYLQEYTDAYTNIVRCNNGIHETIFIGSTTQNTKTQTRANALLISKAPELLEMLQYFANEFENCFHEGTETDIKVKEAKQLIKQATEL